jgi:acyl carrier protein
MDAATLAPDADIREALDIDSMDFRNFVTALHKKLGIDIPERDYPRLVTLAGAVAYLKAKTRSGN